MRLILSLIILLGLSVSLLATDLAKSRLEVYKAKRQLLLFDGDRLIKTYPIALGSNPVSPKRQEGDRATPEGSYYICQKNPHSQYHLSLGISYPGPLDAERGLKAALITVEEQRLILKAAANHQTPPWNTKLGGEVFVHGNGSKPDWTWGCIALDDADIDELYPEIPVGTPITIHP